MKTIIITGPSGSGKSFLSNKLSLLFPDAILIKTDSYYKDNIFIKFLSIIISDLYDRPVSIRRKKLKETLRSIENNNKVINSYSYDFRIRKSSKKRINLKYKVEEQLVILEGIFAHRLNLEYKNTINIICEDNKKICYENRLKRDQLERGRCVNEINKRFDKSWNLFYQNIDEYINNYETIQINPLNKDSYNKLVTNLKILKKN